MQREKTALRREMKSRLTLLPAELFRDAGFRAAAQIISSSMWSQFKTILLFMSMKTEISTLPLLEESFKDNKKVFIPRVEKSRNRISFYRLEPKKIGVSKANPNEQWIINSLNQGYCSLGYQGILEPLPIDPLKEADFPALIFTPGLAFDKSGNRLGYGGGFYDNFFAELKKLEFLTVGLCMEAQILPSVPVEKWDHKVACLCTELEYINIKS